MSAEAEATIPEEHVQFSTSVGYFDKYLEALECLRDEGIITFTDDRIFSKIVDPANVAMCLSKIEGQALNSLSVNGDSKKEIGIRFDPIRDCLSGASNTSELEVTWPVRVQGNNLIRLDVIDEDMQFELSTLNPDTVPQIPQKDPLTHSTRAVVSGKDLKNAVSNASKVLPEEGSSIAFHTHDNVFEIRASDKVDGRFVKKFHQSGPSSEGSLGEHHTEIALKYLDEINTVFGRGDEITVHIKHENPVRFDVDLDENGDAQIVYLIAPRLDE